MLIFSERFSLLKGIQTLKSCSSQINTDASDASAYFYHPQAIKICGRMDASLLICDEQFCSMFEYLSS